MEWNLSGCNCGHNFASGGDLDIIHAKTATGAGYRYAKRSVGVPNSPAFVADPQFIWRPLTLR